MPTKQVPLADLGAQFREVERDVRAAIDRVLASQRFILGPEADALEREVAAASGVRHGVAVSSGTDALVASFLALGIGRGDTVVTTPYTFVATATSIARVGARAVFVDIDADSYAMDASRLVEALEHADPKPRAVVPVHLFGQMADMTRIHEVASSHGVPVLEDGAQAIGARFDGRPMGHGSLGATLSFFPSKNLGAMGDGGMVLTDDDAFAARVRLLRNHGQEPRYHCREVGGNFRMDELQAAILRAKLPYLEGWTARRRRLAARYRSGFEAHGLTLLSPVDVRASHVHHQLVMRTPERDALRAHLERQGIATAVYYPVPLHLQQAFAPWGYARGAFPVAERAAEETLALPLYPELPEEDVDAVVAGVAAFFARRA
jgi:dTDP-4-amino-4,6-dideoxygalactose transaminase